MKGVVSDTQGMIASMDPALDETLYRFMAVTPDAAPQLLGSALATFREDEGVSAIVPDPLASEMCADGPLFARITLRVNSDLEGVGLTAAVATALADEGIACNVVAALHHDHLFVTAERADNALEILKDLAASKRR